MTYFDASHFSTMCHAWFEPLRDHLGRVCSTTGSLWAEVLKHSGGRVCKVSFPSMATSTRAGFVSEKNSRIRGDWMHYSISMDTPVPRTYAPNFCSSSSLSTKPSTRGISSSTTISGARRASSNPAF